MPCKTFEIFDEMILVVLQVCERHVTPPDRRHVAHLLLDCLEPHDQRIRFGGKTYVVFETDLQVSLADAQFRSNLLNTQIGT